MMVIDSRLRQREAEDRPIQVGLLGAGEMSTGLINQITKYVPGMRVAAVYNRTQDKAQRAYATAGIKSTMIASCANEVDEAIERKQAVVVDSAELLWDAESIDVVVEMTGTLQIAFDWIMAAFSAGKHVVSFNAELDGTIGPYLQAQAAQCGVRYTLGDGDQPGVTMNLYRQVKMMGFEPLVCGNIKGMLDHYRTPETQRSFAEASGLSVNMVTSFADGTKISLEQASTANATGMRVARRGMHAIVHDGHIDELTGCYDIDELRASGGIVEMVIGAKPSPGVFVFASTDDPLSERFLGLGKLGSGPLYSFYVPYHLLFFELPFSIVRLVDFADGTVDAREEFSVEVVAVAKKDLRAGETLDGLGGFCYYGLCENRDNVISQQLLPAGLAEKLTLKHSIHRDQVLTWDDVVCDGGNNLINAYKTIG